MSTIQEHFICQTCGTQYPASPQPPAACPICLDDRQYIGFNGQAWTTLADLQRDAHQPDPPARARPDRHRHPAGLRHRPACLAGADAGRERAVGLHQPARRCHGRGSAGAGRDLGHRHLPPAFLLLHDRVEPGLRRPGLPARRRPASGSCAPTRPSSSGRARHTPCGMA